MCVHKHLFLTIGIRLLYHFIKWTLSYRFYIKIRKKNLSSFNKYLKHHHVERTFGTDLVKNKQTEHI